MGIIADRDAALNKAISEGRVLDVFTDIYHPDVIMLENTEVAGEGLQANFEREKQFFGNIEEFLGGGVSAGAVDEDEGTSFAKMSFHAKLKDGSEMNMTEVAHREWKDGKIIREQFFYNAG